MIASLVVRSVPDEKTFQKIYDKLVEHDLIRYIFDEGLFNGKTKEAYFRNWEEQSWEYYDADMRIIAEDLPEFTFELTCQDNYEHWRAYYNDMAAEICFGEVIYQAPQKIKWDALAPF